MVKQNKKYISVILITFLIVNILFNSIIAVGFDPSGSTGDDETYKEYTAKLLDFQFNTIMTLNLDDELNTETPITMLGSIQLHHVKDSEIELLENEPTLELVNENGDISATTEIYNMPNTDTYYFDIYDLNVNNNDQYKLLISFTDNYGNDIEKYVTYDGSMYISQHQQGTMTYKSSNNIAIITFNLSDSSKIESQAIIKGDMNRNGILDEEDAEQILKIVKKELDATTEMAEIADMNGDGNVTLADYTIVLSKLKTKGDINRDGLVDSADAAIALNLYKYNNATEEDIEHGDMDDNGMIDSADAAMILNAYKYSN